MTIVIECKQIGGSLACGGFHKCPETIGWENDAPRNTVSLFLFLNLAVSCLESFFCKIYSGISGIFAFFRTVVVVVFKHHA
jgi:hypothetical protein